MKFDDPEQEPPKWVGTNNVILNTPFPGIHIKAWASTKSNDMGVAVAGTRTENVEAISEFIQRDKRFLREQLPENTRIDSSEGWPIYLHNNEESSEPKRYSWLKKNLNTFVNVLRPRLRQWYQETK